MNRAVSLAGAAFAASLFLAALAQDPAAPPAPSPSGGEASQERPASALPSPAPPGPGVNPANELEAAAWDLVLQYSTLYGVEEQAARMFRVIQVESRCKPKARSRCGRYFGICQFTQRTFRRFVRTMKLQGLLPAEERFSPMNPDHAVRVMAWMWSQGLQRHWGPFRRLYGKGGVEPPRRAAPQPGGPSPPPEEAAPSDSSKNDSNAL